MEFIGDGILSEIGDVFVLIFEYLVNNDRLGIGIKFLFSIKIKRN